MVLLSAALRCRSLDTETLADGAYLFRVVADGKTASGANKAIIDNTVPVVSITKPSNGALIIESPPAVPPLPTPVATPTV